MNNRRSTAVAILLAILAVAIAFCFLRVRNIEAVKSEHAAKFSDDADARAMAALEKRTAFLREWNASRKPKHVETNAADIYRQAFEMFDALSDEEKKMLKNPRDEVDADAAAELFKKIQPIMELLRKASGADYCDWGLGKIKFDTPMTHISQSMDLGRVALWSAGYRIASDPGGALDDLAAQRNLARTLPDTVIGVLVESSMNSGVNDLLSTNARTLDAQSSARAGGMLLDNFLPDDLTRAFKGETDAVRAMADEWQGKSMDDAAKFLAAAQDGGAGKSELDKLRAAGLDLPQVVQQMRDTAKFEEQLLPVLGAPEAQFSAAWQQLQAQTNSNYVAKMILPSLDTVRNKVIGSQVQNAMLGTAFAIIQNGPAQIGTVVDPSTNQPFIYTQTADGGFQLTSTFQMKGKPVTMTFPPAK